MYFLFAGNTHINNPLISTRLVFDFNLYSSLLIPGFLQGMFFAGLLAWRSYQEERLADRLLALILLLLCFHLGQYLLGFGGWYDAEGVYSTFMFYFPFHNFPLIAPLIYFYFYSLTNRQWTFQRRDWLHFIPGFIAYLPYLYFILYDWGWVKLIQGAEFIGQGGTQGPAVVRYQFLVEEVSGHVGIIFILLYGILTIRNYRRYRRYLVANFADEVRNELGWLRNLLVLVTVGLSLNILVYAGIYLGVLQSGYIDYWKGYFVLSVVVYFLSVFGYSQTSQLSGRLAFPVLPSSEAGKEGIAMVNDQELANMRGKLLEHMAQQQPFLDPEITLNDLAEQLRIPPGQLSRIINQGFSCNFSEFINRYRVAHVQQLLLQGEAQQFTLLAIALNSGFNSKATFNRVFKKMTGKTPGDFLADHR